VLRFAQLLGARVGERYLPIGPDRFVVLSDALRRHLDALAGLGTVTGDQLRASPALLSVLDELTAGTHVILDPRVRARLDALQEIADWAPRLPRGFQATLRDYQREGYTWLARLARAGLGACLADDMGLGKTVQALALLCQRARLGPAMVVCPTSVVHNWAAEAARFTSVLRIHVLADEEDRAQRLCSLRARDLVLCSYGLLDSVSDTLGEVEFSTVVFDEAHALKNQETKRAAAARLVRAEHRLALTGTPVENHLGELWSLFNVIQPGLLGSHTHFDDAFTNPIAAGNRERAAQLRALLRPFLLRRTKTQVLDELPPRSEVTIHVEPNAEERAFYEALRRRAVERVTSADSKKVRFEILAELTRLRQAAIDPRLVDPAKGPTGAKLDVLMAHLVELRSEGHRALVFTQFLGSMALVRERLQAAGIEYLDLDGSTPAAERARRIDAFQAGEGDVFVLSLRAGGVGINLTGADYVFHLDPWWNPAVEDQATDRAHRIGQQRPVTVYRLVTEGTIEDKVMALHESKRQLADDVLSGHEHATTPKLDELRHLLDA
jgi:SNF2 family DNA or RNA helicase